MREIRIPAEYKMTVRDVAHFLGITQLTIRTYIKGYRVTGGKVHLLKDKAALSFPKPKRVFGRYEFDRRAIEQWYQDQTVRA